MHSNCRTSLWDIEAFLGQLTNQVPRGCHLFLVVLNHLHNRSWRWQRGTYTGLPIPFSGLYCWWVIIILPNLTLLFKLDKPCKYMPYGRVSHLWNKPSTPGSFQSRIMNTVVMFSMYSITPSNSRAETAAAQVFLICLTMSRRTLSRLPGLA